MLAVCQICSCYRLLNDGVEDPIKRFSNTMKKRFASVKVILRQPKRVLTREQIRNAYSKLFNPQKLNPNNK